jgi:cytochrome b6-f complex iron-sulfur subunit
MRDEKKHTPDAKNPSRRGFLTRLWVGLGILASAELIAVVGAFLRPGRPKAKAGAMEGLVDAGPVDKFPLNSVTAFVGGKFYLARLEDGGFLALSRKCTHLGCTVPWLSNEMKFVCPCHASAYDIRGEVINPPAQRALDIHPVTIENNVVKVDTGKTRKRSGFSAGDVTYPGKSS